MKKRSLSLAVRIIGITLILLALIFTGLTLQVSKQIRQGVFEVQSHNVQQSAIQLRELLDSSIGGLSRRVSLVSKTEALINSVIHDDKREMEQLVKDSYNSENFFDSVYITDPQGNILVNHPFDNQVGSNLSEENWFEPVVFEGESQYFDPHGEISSVSGSPVLTLASPILHENEYEEMVLVGVFIARIDLDKFDDEIIRSHSYGETGYAYLIADDGTLLGHPSLPLVESSLWNYDFTQEMVNSTTHDGSVHYEWTDGWKYAFYSKLDNIPWIVAASIYDDDLLSLSLELQASIIYISLGALLILGIILLLSVIFFVSRPISKISYNVSSGAESLESASFQISSSSQQQSSFASELAASVEEISSSIEELQAVVELNTKNINQSELMMKETNQGSQQVSAKMEELKEALGEINDNSRQIVKIIKVIEDIAFQTNILALNAAVEAARAGDAGRGFAVVADQVKDLAQKSAGAANETAQLIDKGIVSVARGEELGEHVLGVQLKAGEMAQKVTTLLDEVNRSSQEQMRGINQITQAIGQTNQGVQQSAASSEETAAASEELLSQAEELNSLVDQLNLLVKGKIDEKRRTDATARKEVSSRSSATQNHRDGHSPSSPGTSQPRIISPSSDGRGGIEVQSAEQMIPFDEDEPEFKDF